jgi:hypothetical protein
MATIARSFCVPLRFPFPVVVGRTDEHANLLFVLVCPHCEGIRTFNPTSEGVVSKDVAEICSLCQGFSVPLIVGE